MLDVQNIHFGYTDKKVLDNISFTVKEGKNLAVIGESGSGKSTLLKLIYGEYDLDKGSIAWKKQNILGPKFNLVVGYPFMKYVAQEFDLMPFTSVEENIGEYLSNFFPEEKAQRTEELIKVVELQQVAKRKVKTLSGGQKQRVALARALAKEPEILLLDEPFSHIDNFKKQSLRRNIFNYLKSKNIACIVATHDKSDVLGFADSIILLHNKKIKTEGHPELLYNNPQSALMASFFNEFNEIDDKIYYAHQLQIVEESNFEAKVRSSYFNGRNWLIELDYNSKSIFIEHHIKLAEKTSVFFEIMN